MDSKKSFLLRMDPELWAELQSWAAGELRSINGQIEYLLREAVLKRRGALSNERVPESKSDGEG
jgi:hypothetical protein